VVILRLFPDLYLEKPMKLLLQANNNPASFKAITALGTRGDHGQYA
jgi:hypothetical protein